MILNSLGYVLKDKTTEKGNLPVDVDTDAQDHHLEYVHSCKIENVVTRSPSFFVPIVRSEIR